jgi:hypothetical protein
VNIGSIAGTFIGAYVVFQISGIDIVEMLGVINATAFQTNP